MVGNRDSYAAARAFVQTLERGSAGERSLRTPPPSGPRPQGAVAAAAAALASLPKFTPTAAPATDRLRHCSLRPPPSPSLASRALCRRGAPCCGFPWLITAALHVRCCTVT